MCLLANRIVASSREVKSSARTSASKGIKKGAGVLPVHKFRIGVKRKLLSLIIHEI